MTAENRFKDDMLHHVTKLHADMSKLTGAITSKEWEAATDAASSIIFRATQMNLALISKTKEKK
jgi:hypothetical protein